jgi:hypothetical protein
MKTIPENRTHQGRSTSVAVPERTSLQADRELAHIGAVLRAVSATSAALPISAGYWKARLRDLRISYTLLPVQPARLSALELSVEEIEEEAIPDSNAECRVA